MLKSNPLVNQFQLSMSLMVSGGGFRNVMAVLRLLPNFAASIVGEHVPAAATMASRGG